MSTSGNEPVFSHKHTLGALDQAPDGGRPHSRSQSQTQSLGSGEAPLEGPRSLTSLSQTSNGPNSRHVTARAPSAAFNGSSQTIREQNSSDQALDQNGASETADTTGTPPHELVLNDQQDGEEQYVVPSDEWDLGAPVKDGNFVHTLESFADFLFAEDHLKNIFADQTSMLNFTSFVSSCQPQSLPLLKYYLDAMESSKAVAYALSITSSMRPIAGHDFTTHSVQTTLNAELEKRASDASKALAAEVLPSFVSQMYVQTVKSVMAKRIITTATVPPREALEGVLEAFCLTDPSRHDNPIVFASEGFHQMTQYNMNYVIGRNCRFLQGPKTSTACVDRIRASLKEGRDHCDLVLNYRRDGSPFVNLLMMCHLRDISGKIRYVLGAQIDVSNLAPDTMELEDEATPKKVSENVKHLDEGGQQFSDSRSGSPNAPGEWNRPGVLLRDSSNLVVKQNRGAWVSSRLGGFYQNYLLIRPYPSLRILFASHTLQMPGMLQSPIIEKIGANTQVREELVSALARGRSVTAKVRWAPKQGDRGRSRWIAFTPLVGTNKQIGVWIAILIDDDAKSDYRIKQAPPVRFRHGSASREIASKEIIGSIPEEPQAAEEPTRSFTPHELKELKRATSLRKALPLPPPEGSLLRATPPPAPQAEAEEYYETLEERLRKKREREAARLLNSGQAVKPTYKSLSPYAFMNNDGP